MITFNTKLLSVIKRTRNVKSFRFNLPEKVLFKPGQFFSVAIRVDGKEMAKYFSLSNSPTETGYVEFTKRITESSFSQALDKLKAGDKATLKMPFGSFTFCGEYDKIAFISGGIGITPIRSICKFLTDKKLPTDVVLLYGNSTEEDIVFKEDFAEMEIANKNIKVFHTLTSPDVDKNKWKGLTGYIDESMIKEKIKDYKERVFFVCGPPRMVGGIIGILENKLGIQKDKIRLENFAGY